MKRSLSVMLLLYCVVLLASCSAPKSTPKSARQITEAVNCVAVLPTRALSDENGNTQSVTLRRGAALIDTLMAREIGANTNVRILRPEEMDSLYIGEGSGLVAVIRSVSQMTGCDAVMITTVRRFKQREGGEYAADAPASASFDLRIVDAKSKNVLWATDFDETQQSLFSNIFSFGKAQSRGFKWITVEELVSQGVKERLADCPYLKI